MEKQGGKSNEKPKKYGIDAEIGRLEVPTYEIKKGSQKVFSTERDVFPETGSKAQSHVTTERRAASRTQDDGQPCGSGRRGYCWVCRNQSENDLEVL